MVSNATPTSTAPRMKQRFEDRAVPKLREEFGVTNRMALPRLDKIVINVGMGKQLEGTKLNAKAREQVIQSLSQITGQRPVMRKAVKSVANFKLRAGYEIGAMVTLRGVRMWEFLDRLVNLAIPRIKDFRGLSDKKFDGRGSYSFGVTEQGIFPEVDMSRAEFIHGMNINLVLRNSTDAMSRTVLAELGFPFVKPEEKQR